MKFKLDENLGSSIPGVGLPGCSRRGESSPSLHLHKYASRNMLLCMRTTIEITDTLFREAKKRAAEDGTSLKDLVEAALRGYLQGAGKQKQPYRFQWTPMKGKLREGVDLDDRNSLYDLMDGLDD